MCLFVILMIGVAKVGPVGGSVLLLILVSKINHEYFCFLAFQEFTSKYPLDWVEHCGPCGQHQKIKFSIQIDPVDPLLQVSIKKLEIPFA